MIRFTFISLPDGFDFLSRRDAPSHFQLKKKECDFVLKIECHEQFKLKNRKLQKKIIFPGENYLHGGSWRLRADCNCTKKPAEYKVNK